MSRLSKIVIFAFASFFVSPAATVSPANPPPTIAMDLTASSSRSGPHSTGEYEPPDKVQSAVVLAEHRDARV